MSKDRLIEFIKKNKELLRLPKVVDKGNEVIKEINCNLNKLKKELKESGLEFDTRKIEYSSDRIKEAFKAYFSGDLSKAVEKISMILNQDTKLRGEISVECMKSLLEGNEICRLYKARVGGFQGYHRDEMFHIPFDKRGIIQNQRYSINGIPCLYLATSIYGCWEELNRPEFNKMWISRYEATPDIKVLDLSRTVEALLNEIAKETVGQEEIEKYLNTWVLQLACSISVKENERTFKEEYIIPQLVMQSIKKEGIDGVMYFSTKGTYDHPNKEYIMRNIALPAIPENHVSLSVKDRYSNSLKSKFEWTQPVNMGLILGISDGCISHKLSKIRAQRHQDGKKELGGMVVDRENGILTISGAIPMYYKDSIFFDIERALDLI